MREENKVLYQKLYDFVREAVGVLSKMLNVGEIQILSRHNIERKDNMIFLYGGDDWRKIEGLEIGYFSTVCQRQVMPTVVIQV